MNTAPNDAIILIGPVGAGKSTIGGLLAERLGWPRYAMDDLRWAYYAEIGYDHEAIVRQARPEEGFLGIYRQWKPFEIHAVERILADHPHGVIDFGAGHSVYEDDALFERAQRALAPFPNVVLLLPSPDLDESIRLLQERNPDDGGLNAHFVRHHSNHDLAKITVYTHGQEPPETSEEIIRRIGIDRG